MASGPAGKVLRHLRAAALVPAASGPGDGPLLEQFVARRDEAAFAALLRRHGPMVLGVCRRLLGHVQDAEDAFQATFLVLARRAAAVAPAELVGNWLYGVAYQTALKARATRARRRARERQVTAMPEREAPRPGPWRELRPLLDRELSRLPDNYRAVLVLCDLEGKTRKEAARLLGWPEGSVCGRLARARKLLAGRLARQGVTLPAAALAAVLTQNAASAAVPAALADETVRAAGLFAAGSAAAGVVAPPVAALTDGVLQAMWTTKLKFVAVSVVLSAALFAGAGLPALPALSARAAEGPPQAQPARPAPGGAAKKGQAADYAKFIDQLLAARFADKWEARFSAARGQSDEEFIRRLSLDLRGTMPSRVEIYYFVRDKGPDKRKKLLELMGAESRAQAKSAWERYFDVHAEQVWSRYASSFKERADDAARQARLKDWVELRLKKELPAFQALSDVEDALKRLRESDADEAAQLRALDEIEKQVKDLKRQARQKKAGGQR
ncbi:MAG TPA: sigma-70 family RNA polymerase sigma factor [Gemmataceae bacterium]|nr:sigma-70 family RNA polymerase sigma factor [Gemmataceae bacterium]